ncbi:hypothetical protein ABZ401_19475 [Streptomyces sp. NPDC005892]|uniref:hypothetical protein n=1 Tax=Streptomyces sp. NPDC005892 TaxID=3155593 RepID=UPI0033F58CE3
MSDRNPDIDCAVLHRDSEGRTVRCPGDHLVPPPELSDADLLAWAVVSAHRERQERDGINILRLPYPPCPTCGEPVNRAEQVTTDRLRRDVRLTVKPCGHVHTADGDRGESLWVHFHELVTDVASRYESYTVGVRAWTTDEILREARARVAGATPDGEKHPAPASDVAEVRPDPRQPAHDAVFEYIRSLGEYLPPDRVHRNAVIWRAVQAALDATPVGRCVSSHCVEGDDIIDLGDAHA